MTHDGRALKDREVLRIQADVFNGLYNDADINRLFETIYLQKKILRALINLWHAEPLRLISVAEPLRNSQLAHWKELVALDDPAR